MKQFDNLYNILLQQYNHQIPHNEGFINSANPVLLQKIIKDLIEFTKNKLQLTRSFIFNYGKQEWETFINQYINEIGLIVPGKIQNKITSGIVPLTLQEWENSQNKIVAIQFKQSYLTNYISKKLIEFPQIYRYKIKSI